MVFCSKCGQEIPDDAYFCTKCGVRTKKGVEANIPIPWKEAFSDMGREIEKAFSTAGKEIEKAFKTVREDIRRTTGGEPVTCSHCGEKNFADARFCHKCGKGLT